MAIHPTSIISKDAEIHETAEIGPFCVIRGKAKIGARTVLDNNVTLGSEIGVVEVGEDNKISPGAVIGGDPQDLKYKGEEAKLVIGNRNTLRECVTVNFGTPGGGGITRIGDDCLIMTYSHIAHDCLIGNHVVIANSCQFAGHVIVEDHAKINGVCCFTQFMKVGTHAYVAGDSTANKDIIPYSMAQGKYCVARATNKIGMERAGIAKDVIESVNRAIRILIKGKHTIDEALAKIALECGDSKEVKHLVEFVRSSEKGIAK